MATIEFKLPDIGEGVAEGEIVSWKVKAGDRVVEDQVMVEVMTDKATVEIGAPADGTIVELRAAEGATVPVGDVIVVLEGAGAGAARAGGGGHGAGKTAAASKPAATAAAAPAATAAAAPGKTGAAAKAETSGKAGAPAKAAPGAPRVGAPSASTAQPGAAVSASGGGNAEGDVEEIDFALPDIGEGVAEGEITKWIVKPGDTVREDQPMLEVMTDKATVEIGSPVDGEVLQLLHPEGATVPVGGILLVLGTRSGAPRIGGHAAVGAPRTGASSGAAAAGAAPVAARGVQLAESSNGPGAGQRAGVGAAVGRGSVAVATAPRASTLSDTGLPPRNDGGRRVRAAPAVRRLARELGVEIGLLEGSGPGGRVTMDDVRSVAGGRAGHAAPAPAAVTGSRGAAAATPAATRPAAAGARAPAAGATAAPVRPAAAPAGAPVGAAPAIPAPAAVRAPAPHVLEADERVPLRGLRKVIAKQMRLAKQTAAHFAYVEELDVTELVALRTSGKEAAAAKGVKLTYMPFIIKATCIALKEFPLLNASLDEAAGELVYHHRINMGFAVDTPGGLVVPVIRDADRKSMLVLSQELFELAERARAGKVRPDDIGGGTFTITNAGNIGGLLATPIINVPEVAILGVHAIRRRPWVVGEQIVIRDIMYLSLSLDHRVVDGAVGAYFMNRVKALLEQPALMLLES